MSRQPDPWKSLRDEIRKIQDQIRRMQAASPFFGTGFHPNGDGGMDSDNFVAGESGYSFKADGNAEFNDITLRGGIIGNDALANPVIPGSVWQEASNFTVSPTWTNVISVSVTVPDDCTSASISAKGRITAFNNAGTGSGLDYLYAHVYIGALSSDYYPVAVTDGGGSGTNQVFRDAVLTGLTPGSTFSIVLQTSTDYATWTAPSSPGNKAKLGASISWYR